MSRIGSKAISLPEDVNVSIVDSNVIVKGPKGMLNCIVTGAIEVVLNGQELSVITKKNDKDSRSKWGLYRALVNNMVIGVKEGFKKTLEIKGVGYKASSKDGFLNLSLGYSHDIKVEIPDDIDINIIKATTIELSSYNKESLGLFASNIKKLRMPEPYKGKGVRYLGEFIVRKEGKK
ncbi:MAG: 50S ribosomal protein L6 [Rickettsiales bacterium]|jgi:large subunit ribosomal protein L6|nr:50S ribosomal protein L6 [Rickettsiales bacterium]